jgi:transposase
MIGPPSGMHIWLACDVTDLRNGFDGLAAIVQTKLCEHAYSGQLFAFRGRRGDRIKLLWWDGDGLCLFSKRLENGRSVWRHQSRECLRIRSIGRSPFRGRIF